MIMKRIVCGRVAESRRGAVWMNAATGIAAVCLSITVGACRQEAVAPPVQTQGNDISRAQAPDCAGVEQWPTSMAFAHLKNAGITDNDRLDFAKTKTARLASEPIKDGLFRQVHHVTFTEKSGNMIEVITLNDVSNDECSMSGVDVFVISRHLGPN